MILNFRQPRRTCTGCGIAISGSDSACLKCRTWDQLLHAMSLRHQALGDLARAGGAL